MIGVQCVPSAVTGYHLGNVKLGGEGAGGCQGMAGKEWVSCCKLNMALKELEVDNKTGKCSRNGF